MLVVLRAADVVCLDRVDVFVVKVMDMGASCCHAGGLSAMT